MSSHQQNNSVQQHVFLTLIDDVISSGTSGLHQKITELRTTTSQYNITSSINGLIQLSQQGDVQKHEVIEFLIRATLDGHYLPDDEQPDPYKDRWYLSHKTSDGHYLPDDEQPDSRSNEESDQDKHGY